MHVSQLLKELHKSGTGLGKLVEAEKVAEGKNAKELVRYCSEHGLWGEGTVAKACAILQDKPLMMECAAKGVVEEVGDGQTRNQPWGKGSLARGLLEFGEGTEATVLGAREGVEYKPKFADYMEWTSEELHDECEKRGLPKSGTKEEMSKRLQEYDRKGPPKEDAKKASSSK